jgi:hypothetical protein
MPEQRGSRTTINNVIATNCFDSSTKPLFPSIVDEPCGASSHKNSETYMSNRYIPRGRARLEWKCTKSFAAVQICRPYRRNRNVDPSSISFNSSCMSSIIGFERPLFLMRDRSPSNPLLAFHIDRRPMRGCNARQQIFSSRPATTRREQVQRDRRPRRNVGNYIFITRRWTSHRDRAEISNIIRCITREIQKY